MTTTNLTSSKDRAFTIAGQTVTASVVANDFLRLLRREIGRENFREACIRNASPDYAFACASHDFCDANMVMLEAVTANGLPDDDLDALTDLMNAAWAIARERMVAGGASMCPPVGERANHIRLLTAFGHSGEKALEIAIDAERGDDHAAGWIELAKKRNG